MPPRDRDRGDSRDSDLNEKVVYINRVAKVQKGGRRFSFSALVVVGDGRGSVGAGMGKANEVPDAIRKGSTIARKAMIKIPMQGNTVPHPVTADFGAAKVLIRPASQGTGVIAGGGVRAVMEAAGVKDVLTKTLGSRNPINVVRAAIAGLAEMKDVAKVRRQRAEWAALPVENVIRRGKPPVARVPRDRDRDRGDRRRDRGDRPEGERSDGGARFEGAPRAENAPRAEGAAQAITPPDASTELPPAPTSELTSAPANQLPPAAEEANAPATGEPEGTETAASTEPENTGADEANNPASEQQ